MLDMSKIECHELLDRSLVGRLAMVSPDGRPYTIPMRYVWHDAAIYVRIAYDGRKQEALEFARRVCFETDEVEDDFSHYASVLVEGVLLDIHDDTEKRSALVALNEKYSRLAGLANPGPNPVTRGVAIRRITVESISGKKSEPTAPRPSVRHLELTPALRRVKR